MGWSAGKVDDVTACRIQDGGYALLWQRYDNNKMAAIFYIFSHRLDLLYIFLWQRHTSSLGDRFFLECSGSSPTSESIESLRNILCFPPLWTALFRILWHDFWRCSTLRQSSCDYRIKWSNCYRIRWRHFPPDITTKIANMRNKSIFLFWNLIV